MRATILGTHLVRVRSISLRFETTLNSGIVAKLQFSWDWLSRSLGNLKGDTMYLRRASVAAVTAIVLLSIPQIAMPQTTDYWYVVRDATDLSYKFQTVCVGDRGTAQDVVAGLRILEHDGSIHALPERAFRVQQEAGLIDSVVKELLCGGGSQLVKK
jgi:hypothetical protein